MQARGLVNDAEDVVQKLKGIKNPRAVLRGLFSGNDRLLNRNQFHFKN